MIKIFIGKRDYRYNLSSVLWFINHESSRELTYSVDNDKADVYVNTTELCSSEYIKEHSEELPEDIFVHIEEGLGIYVDGEAMSIHVLEDYIGRMQ